MNEQLIAQLQLLIELAKTGEPFNITGFTLDVRINKSKHRVEVKSFVHDWIETNISFNELLDSTIIRKPWKPKVGENYWTWLDGASFGDYYASRAAFNCAYDLHVIAFGNCFRTKEECESHTEIRDKLIAMRKECE